MEAMSDIQNYLDTFQKDLQTGANSSSGNSGSSTSAGMSAVVSGSTEVRQVYIDNSLEVGQYYIRETPPVVTPVVRRGKRGRPPSNMHQLHTAVAHSAYNTRHQQQQQCGALSSVSASTLSTATLVSASSGPAVTGDSAPHDTAGCGQQAQTSADCSSVAASSQILPHNYQAVTIVPAENSDNEVSYVLIVQPDGEDGVKAVDPGGGGDAQTISMFDFTEEDKNKLSDSATGIILDDKKIVLRGTPGTRKQQFTPQAFMCSYCNYTSPKRYLLSRHMKSHSDDRPHKCAVCERGFKTLASLQNHVNTHTGTKPHSCKFCEATFTTSGELIRHVRYIHTKEKPHHCTECDYSSVELSKLRRHIRSHTGERPYQCPHCTYASPDTFKLKRHLRIHTGEKPYECDVCGSRFTQSNSLKAHKMIHTGAKPSYQCELCPTTCGRKTDLRIHIQKLHTSDKPIKCKRCGKSFPDRYSYKLHNKAHDGEKCFKCDLCPYSSINQRHLESHMFIHTDQKPFICPHCDQSFRQKQLLKRHINLYHNPHFIPSQPREKLHECPECGRSFRHKGNLIRHLTVHDPDASVAEKQLALKLGRERKISVDVMDQSASASLLYNECVDEGVDDEAYAPTDPDNGQRMVAVQGQDGQQYVVLEVIQLQDASGEAQTVAVVPDTALEQTGSSSVGMLPPAPHFTQPSTSAPLIEAPQMSSHTTAHHTEQQISQLHHLSQHLHEEVGTGSGGVVGEQYQLHVPSSLHLMSEAATSGHHQSGLRSKSALHSSASVSAAEVCDPGLMSAPRTTKQELENCFGFDDDAIGLADS